MVLHLSLSTKLQRDESTEVSKLMLGRAILRGLSLEVPKLHVREMGSKLLLHKHGQTTWRLWIHGTLVFINTTRLHLYTPPCFLHAPSLYVTWSGTFLPTSPEHMSNAK